MGKKTIWDLALGISVEQQAEIERIKKLLPPPEEMARASEAMRRLLPDMKRIQLPQAICGIPPLQDIAQTLQDAAQKIKLIEESKEADKIVARGGKVDNPFILSNPAAYIKKISLELAVRAHTSIPDLLNMPLADLLDYSALLDKELEKEESEEKRKFRELSELVESLIEHRKTHPPEPAPGTQAPEVDREINPILKKWIDAGQAKQNDKGEYVTAGSPQDFCFWLNTNKAKEIPPVETTADLLKNNVSLETWKRYYREAGLKKSTMRG